MGCRLGYPSCKRFAWQWVYRCAALLYRMQLGLYVGLQVCSSRLLSLPLSLACILYVPYIPMVPSFNCVLTVSSVGKPACFDFKVACAARCGRERCSLWHEPARQCTSLAVLATRVSMSNLTFEGLGCATFAPRP